MCPMPVHVSSVRMCFCTEFNIIIGTPTLLRKKVASAADDDEDTKAVKKTLAALSAHSVETMDKHNNLSKAESDTPQRRKHSWWEQYRGLRNTSFLQRFAGCIQACT